MLLPEALHDSPPMGHLAYSIRDAVGALDFGAFRARYDKDGSRHQLSHKAMMALRGDRPAAENAFN